MHDNSAVATKLLIQPDDGMRPLLQAIARARASVDLTIFRFDAPELEAALAAAVERGVVVRALIAHSNSSGETELRALEDRLLGHGVTIDRSPDQFVRYHSKLLVVDKRSVFVLGFNYTKVDMLKSRSFGVMSTEPSIVRDVTALLAADANRQVFRQRSASLVISPDNARQRLARFIAGAQHAISIYDPCLTDDGMIQALKRRAEDGVRVRILGELEKKWRNNGLLVQACPLKRLHVRAMIRDGKSVFVGSQSLRRLELDERREVGVFVRAASVVQALTTIFDGDWRSARGKEDF